MRPRSEKGQKTKRTNSAKRELRKEPEETLTPRKEQTNSDKPCEGEGKG